MDSGSEGVVKPLQFKTLKVGDRLIHLRTGYPYLVVDFQTRNCYGKVGSYPIVDANPPKNWAQKDTGCHKMIASTPSRWGLTIA
jgi:hypothetical protein